jgi:putative acetyltransferase
MVAAPWYGRSGWLAGLRLPPRRLEMMGTGGEMSVIKIRRAKDHDVPHLRRLFSDYASELRLDLGFQHFAQELEGLPGDYARPKGELLLALEGGLPVGCVAMRPLAPGICEMKRLYVRPSYRGKGLGKQLIDAILAAARRAEYACMRLDTLSSMKAARFLYSAFGFKPIRPYYHNPLEGAEYMELDLTRPEP